MGCFREMGRESLGEFSVWRSIILSSRASGFGPYVVMCRLFVSPFCTYFVLFCEHRIVLLHLARL